MTVNSPTTAAAPPKWLGSLTSHIPPGQFLRYVLVGGWNTVFGYGLFALLTAILDPRIPHGYVVAILLSNLISISVAFLGYKWFVFKTKGNYLREWLRCITVYSGGVLMSTILLPILVYLLRHGTRLDRSAPYVGGAILMVFNVLYNFLGHKHFSFRPQAPGPPIDQASA